MGVATSSSKRSLGGADQAQPEDDLPRFGAASAGAEDGRPSKFKDPFQAEHDELDDLVGNALKNDQNQAGDPQGRSGKQQAPAKMTNEDSFSNIAPAAVDSKKKEDGKSAHSKSQKDIDKVELNEDSF